MPVTFCHVGSQGRGRAVVLESLYILYAKRAQLSLFRTSLCPSLSSITLSAIAYVLKGGDMYKPSDILEVAFVFYFKQKLLCGCCIFAGVSELVILPPG